MAHRVSEAVRCPRCGAEARRSYVVATGARIRASRSLRCDSCGFAEETDGELTDEEVAQLGDALKEVGATVIATRIE